MATAIWQLIMRRNIVLDIAIVLLVATASAASAAPNKARTDTMQNFVSQTIKAGSSLNSSSLHTKMVAPGNIRSLAREGSCRLWRPASCQRKR
jgi:hypothetical protein